MKGYFGLALRANTSRGKAVLLGALGLALLFGAWAFLSYTRIIGPIFLPNPTEVVRATIILFRDLDFSNDILITLYRLFLGYFIAVVVSVPFGIMLATSRTFDNLFRPLISFLRYIPVSALVPLLILWFGIGDLQKIILIFLGVTTYLSLMTFDVVANTKKEYIEAAYTLGAKPDQVLSKVIIPQSMPGIWDTMRINISAAWLFVIFAEIISATAGLGYLIITSQRFLRTPNIIATIIITGIIGLIIDFAFRFTYKIFFPWTEKSTNARA